MAYRTSAGGDPGRERWDRDRFQYERDRDHFGDERVRFEEEDRVFTRRSPPPGPRFRDDEPPPRRRPAYVDDYVGRRDLPRFHDDDVPPPRRREDFERRVVIEKEREREFRSPSPPRRPGMVRRQSSLDTFDRRPRPFYEHDHREEYGPPAKRDEFRPPTYVDIPLPRIRGALPAPGAGPPRGSGRHEPYDDDIKVSDPDYYGDEEFRPSKERVREREVVRTTRRRDRSRESKGGKSRKSSSRSSSVTSRSSSSISTVKSEYPKKGKTRIPAKLVSKRAIIDLGYPYEEEGNTIIIQKALGQDNIDDLLRLSEDYKKGELELITARSEAGHFIEERREEIVYAPPPPPPAPAPEPAPVIYNAAPPPPAAPAPPIVHTTAVVVRDVSPARSYTTTTTSTSGTMRATPIIVDGRYREVSDEMVVGPLALAEYPSHHHGHHHHHHSHSRSRSRTGREIRAEIRGLERELEIRRRPRGTSVGGELVRAERLSNGELVLYEERVEKIEEGRRGVRIEKDKKGPPPALIRAMLKTLT